MLLEKKYFRLVSELSLPDIHLGDSIDALVKKDIINKINKADEIEYRYAKNDKVVIVEKNGIVNLLFFTRESVYQFLNLDPYSYPYPATESITEYLSKSFEFLPNVRNNEQLRKQPKGNYMLLIFRDYIPHYLLLLNN